MFCINPMYLNISLRNMGAKVMIFDAYVVSLRMKPRNIHEFDTAFIILKIGGICSSRTKMNLVMDENS